MTDIFIAPKKDPKPTRSTSPKKATGDEYELDFLLPGETKKKVGHAMSAFSLYPQHANFFDRDPKEKVILIVRRHPITNLRWIFVGFVLAVLPFFISPFLTLLNFMPFRFYIIFLLGWYLLTFAFVFENFLSWFFSVDIITDERVVDVTFNSLVYRQVSDCEHRQIQDVTVKVGSVIRTLFNYGDVLIQTAAEIPEIEFDAIPQPDRVDKILRELRRREEELEYRHPDK